MVYAPHAPVARLQYRALISDAIPEAEVQSVLKECEDRAAQWLHDGHIMTAGLYRFSRQLFLYCEALEAPFTPECFMAPAHRILIPWPQKDTVRDWAAMYPVFWHDSPRDAQDWQRCSVPEKRVGRIALLRHEYLFDYVYHHTALVREGLLRGDRYMQIALHEDILFSYHEEPRGSVNIRRDHTMSSAVIQDWINADPDAHFVHLPESNGANFLPVPTVFTVG